MTAVVPTLAGAVVLDTNVVSELMRATPDPRVRHWAQHLPPALVYTTAVTVAEVRLGIARLHGGRRKDRLIAAADGVFGALADRVLPFDAAAASHYGAVVVERERAGAPIGGFDAEIAAICRLRRASLATRNIEGFRHLGLDLIDPWLTDG